MAVWHKRPGIFEKCILKILHGLPGIISYTNYIFVIGKKEKEHDANLEKLLLAKLQLHNICINHEKSEFLKTEITCLGHVISGIGLSPN